MNFYYFTSLHSFTSILSAYNLGNTPRDKTNVLYLGVYVPYGTNSQKRAMVFYSGGDSSRTTPWSGSLKDPLSSSSIRSGTSMVKTMPVSLSSTTSSRVATP